MITSTERPIAIHMRCDGYKGAHAIRTTVTAISPNPRDERIDCAASHSESINGNVLRGDLTKIVK